MSLDFTDDDVETPHERAEITCPQCGAEPTDESVREVQLSNLGYKHGDTSYECTECAHDWVHGVPVGSPDEYGGDLRCEACADGWYLVHRIEQQTDGVRLHLKCPTCYSFTYTNRSWDGAGRALMGYPQITGELNPDKPYGFDGDSMATDDETPAECDEPACIIHGDGTLGCPNAE